MKLATLFSASVLFSLYSCTPEPKGFEPNAGTADFSQVIALGGSYMAGYQDGALNTKGQENSIPAIIATQMQYANGGPFYQVLLANGYSVGLNTKPWESNFVSASKLGYKTDCKGITSLSPIKSTLSDIIAQNYLNTGNKNLNNNFAVPFASLNAYDDPSLGLYFGVNNDNPFYNRIASNPGSSTIISDAKNKKPSFIISWLGMDDIYNYAAKGGANANIPNASTFEQNLNKVLGEFAKSGVKGVMATIPDFKDFPYYNLIPWNNANLTQSQADSLNDTYSSNPAFDHIRFNTGKNGFIVEDAKEPSGFRKMKEGEFITISVPTDSLKCFKYGLVLKVINDRYALIDSEVKILDQAIQEYNQIIVKKANEYGFALADMYQYFKKIKSGVKWNGVDYNLTFVSGGFLSLDGYHPNQKGYGLIANEFIKVINDKYKANVPQTTCKTCDGVLFN
jgi:hypothetical protein